MKRVRADITKSDLPQHDIQSVRKATQNIINKRVLGRY